jgi:imidazolonepropionase-like amidohydrolase
MGDIGFKKGENMLTIENALIITMTGQTIKEGTVLIDKGKIKDIGINISIPKGIKRISAKGKILMPGMIDAHTHLGISEEGLGWEGHDYNEITDPITPHLRAIDGINPHEEGLKDAYMNGITTVMTGPGSANVMGGENLVIKTKGNTVDEMGIKNPAGIKAAFGENPKRVYTDQKKAPTTRMAIAALIRETFMKAQDYMIEKERAERKGEIFKRDIKMESVIKVLKKEIPLKAHAHRADDIMTILRIAKEFDINVTIEHCTEGHKLVKELLDAGVQAIVGPSMSTKVKVELRELSFETAVVLSKAGVKVALMSDHPVLPVKNLPIYASLAVKAGMDEMEALKAITINPAEILGVADRVGSIEVGKDADLVVFSAYPLDIRSRVEMVFINGEKVKG